MTYQAPYMNLKYTYWYKQSTDRIIITTSSRWWGMLRWWG